MVGLELLGLSYVGGCFLSHLLPGLLLLDVVLKGDSRSVPATFLVGNMSSSLSWVWELWVEMEGVIAVVCGLL